MSDDQLYRVFTSNRAKRAHFTLVLPIRGPEFMKDGYPQALCGVTCLEGGFLGTGQQWEQQVADRLPTCGRCKARLDAINEHANKRLEPALEEEFADGHAN